MVFKTMGLNEMGGAEGKYEVTKRKVPYRGDRKLARDLENQECSVQKPREVCVSVREGAVNCIKWGVR